MKLIHSSLFLITLTSIVFALFTNQIFQTNLILYIAVFSGILVLGYILEDHFFSEKECFGGFSFPFLLGLLTVSSLVYLILYLSIYIPILWNLLWIIFLSITLLAFKKKVSILYRLTSTLSSYEFYGILISLITAGLWTQNSIFPWVESDLGVTFIPWKDSFYHAVWTQNIARALTGSPFEDVRNAGSASYFYHAAPYTISSIFVSLTKLSGLEGFLKITTPLSFFCIGISGYLLGSNFKSKLAGFLTVVFLLLFPSADVAGLQTPWFGFHWLLVISPHLGFGIAGLTLGWLLLFKGINESSLKTVLIAWLVTGFTILMKVHLFIINALLIFYLPLFYYKKISAFSRTLITILLAIPIIYILLKVQELGLPVYVYNGSAFNWYPPFVTNHIKSEVIKNVIKSLINTDTLFFNQITFCVFVFLASFGIWGVIWFRYIFSKSFIKNPIFLISVFTIVSYLLSATWGSKSSPSFGNPEEFLHRAVVWSYFLIIVASVSAISGVRIERFISNNKKLCITAVILLLSVPYYLGKNIQTGPSFGLDRTLYPKAYINALSYLKEHSLPNDTFFSFDGDPYFTASAVSQLQLFAFISTSPTFRPNQLLSKRLKDIDSITSGSSLDVVSKINALGTDWFIITPDVPQSVVAALSDKIVFSEGGYFVGEI